MVGFLFGLSVGVRGVVFLGRVFLSFEVFGCCSKGVGGSFVGLAATVMSGAVLHLKRKTIFRKSNPP